VTTICFRHIHVQVLIFLGGYYSLVTGDKKLRWRKQKMPTELWSRNNLKRRQLEYQETDMRENYSI